MGGATLLARYMCIGMLLVMMGGATLLARYMCIGMLLVVMGSNDNVKQKTKSHMLLCYRIVYLYTTEQSISCNL